MKPTLNYFHPDVLYKDDQKEIVRATSEHAAYLQNNMRNEDKFECFLHDVSPWKTWTGVYEGTPVCMFGTTPIKQEYDFRHGTIWMLGSPLVQELYRPFLRLSRLAADYLCNQYDVVENIVPLKHGKTVMWLTWLGFKFYPTTIKIKDTECLRFVRCTSELNMTVDQYGLFQTDSPDRDNWTTDETDNLICSNNS